MSEKIEINLGNVQKTLFLPLWGRAEESKKAKPLLVDPTAERIIEQIDFDFSKMTGNMDDITKIAWIKRSLYSDQVIRNFLNHYPQGTIVNIGCGLDTTFERVDNGQLTWYDLDLPDVITLRSKFIEESARRKFISASFLDEDWLKIIRVNGNVLFLAAGVFYYFSEQEIKQFFLRLLAAISGCELFFDVASPMGVKVANTKVVESAGLDEKSHLTWGLEKKKDILTWHPGIKLLDTYHYFGTLKFGLRNFIMGAISDFFGIQYMLHLRLGEKI